MSVKNFEDFFKSEVGTHKCPHCDGDLVVAKSEDGLVIKSRKKKDRAGIGNGDGTQHKGPKSPKAKVKHSGAGAGGHVERQATKPGNPSTKKSEISFPLNKSFHLAQYGQGDDAEVVKGIEAHGFGSDVTPYRNAEMEQESALAKAQQKESSEESTDEESSEETGDEDTTSDE